VNNDGWTDLVAVQSEYCCAAFCVLLNDQQGGFTLTTMKDTAGPASVMLADLLGNGSLDVVQETGASTARFLYGERERAI
jgi:FG-GAP-like repeat